MRLLAVFVGLAVTLGLMVLLVKNRHHPRLVHDLFGDAEKDRRRARETSNQLVVRAWRADAWLRERPLWMIAFLSLVIVLAGLTGLLIAAL